MKRILLSVLSALTVFVVSAQLSPYHEFSVFDGVHYWVEAGASYGKVTSKNADYKIGWRGGVGIDIPFCYSNVSFLPSIMVENKGYKASNIINSVTKSVEETDLASMYVEIPLDFSVNIAIRKKMGIQVYAGPYFGYGVAGKYTVTSDEYLALYGKRTIELKTFEEQGEEYSNVSKQMRKFDFGFDAGLRFIFLRHAMVRVGCEFGCINANGVETQPAFRNITPYASLAFRY